MELEGRTILLLGGSGMVGHAVARRLLRHAPRRLVLVGLFEDEARAEARELEPHRGLTELAIEWGDVFLPASLARLGRAAVMSEPAHRRLFIADLYDDLTDAVLERSHLYQLLQRHRPDVVVDSINTASAFAYQDMFHSARDLVRRAEQGTLDQAAVERHVLTLTMPQLTRHMQILVEGMRRAETKAYVKIGTSGTGGMGFNIPYTHSEERPSRTLLTKSAVAGAQSLLLFLMARTPGAPAAIEIKPTATVAWRRIACGPVRWKGKPLPLVDCPEPVPAGEAFRPGAAPWKDTGQPFEAAFIDVGENGVFSRDEFETVTALGQMEFITPEEVAESVVSELEGRPTGRDVIAALDAATAGPTYRAGILRAHAIERLRFLEGPGATRPVAYEMLGPPRLSKLLYESYLCSRLRPSVRALAATDPGGLAAEAAELLRRDAALRSYILSIGLPIVLPDGRHVYRGSWLAVPPGEPDPLAAAPRGWVDLRPAQFGVWVGRARCMLEQATAVGASPASGSDVDWTAIRPDDPIEPSRFATWVFRYEDRGERIKR